MKRILFLLLAWQLFSSALLEAETPYPVKVGHPPARLKSNRQEPEERQGQGPLGPRGWREFFGRKNC